MKILMTGATGLLGKDIGKKLTEKGHGITVLTRDPKAAKSQLPFPARLYAWKNYSETVPSSYFDDIDAVIHLAGESIASGRWTKARKKLILESRTIGTKNIVKAIKASKGQVKQFISASAIGFYGDNQNRVTEDSSPGKDFLAMVCTEWEKESLELAQTGVKVINPRIGIVLSRKGGAMDKMLPLFSLGLGGVLGNGKQWMSWIHQDDLTQMFVHFVNHPELHGAFNAVAPHPVTNKDFSRSLAQALNRSLFFPVPDLALKIGLGEMSTLVLKGQNVSSQKISDTGFQFKYRSLTEALNELCAPLQSGQKEIFTEIWLPKKINEVFPFFSDEKNLEKLTPEYLNFHVLSKSTEVIREGTLIDYKLSLHGIPLKWRTLIENWEPGRKFVDRQIKGPYKLWHHTHEFEEMAGGTLIRDRVLYQLPLGRLGELFSGPFVRSDVAKIFNYRKKIITHLFY